MAFGSKSADQSVGVCASVRQRPVIHLLSMTLSRRRATAHHLRTSFTCLSFFRLAVGAATSVVSPASSNRHEGARGVEDASATILGNGCRRRGSKRCLVSPAGSRASARTTRRRARPAGTARNPDADTGHWWRTKNSCTSAKLDHFARQEEHSRSSVATIPTAEIFSCRIASSMNRRCPDIGPGELRTERRDDVTRRVLRPVQRDHRTEEKCCPLVDPADGASLRSCAMCRGKVEQLRISEWSAGVPFGVLADLRTWCCFR